MDDLNSLFCSKAVAIILKHAGLLASNIDTNQAGGRGEDGAEEPNTGSGGERGAEEANAGSRGTVASAPSGH